MHARHDGNVSSLDKETQLNATLKEKKKRKKRITQSQFWQPKKQEPVYDTTPTDFAGLPPRHGIFSKCGEQNG